MTLERWRRTDGEGGGETGRPGRRLWNDDLDGADKDRQWTIRELLQDSGVGHGTDGTFVAGKPGLSGVYVIRLDKSDETHEQRAEQGYRSEPCRPVVVLSGTNQVDLSQQKTSPTLQL